MTKYMITIALVWSCRI